LPFCRFHFCHKEHVFSEVPWSFFLQELQDGAEMLASTLATKFPKALMYMAGCLLAAVACTPELTSVETTHTTAACGWWLMSN
jgi:hypothetical protein